MFYKLCSKLKMKMETKRRNEDTNHKHPAIDKPAISTTNLDVNMQTNTQKHALKDVYHFSVYNCFKFVELNGSELEAGHEKYIPS